MRLSILWRIMEIEEGVIRRGRRPRRITPSEISIILPIYISGEKIDNVVSSLEKDGNTTGRWYKSNYLTGNPSKYQVLVMSRAKQGVKKAVHIEVGTLSRVIKVYQECI